MHMSLVGQTWFCAVATISAFRHFGVCLAGKCRRVTVDPHTESTVKHHNTCVRSIPPSLGAWRLHWVQDGSTLECSELLCFAFFVLSLSGGSVTENAWQTCMLWQVAIPKRKAHWPEQRPLLCSMCGMFSSARVQSSKKTTQPK